MCPASAEDKCYAIRLIKYSFKKSKKIKNTCGVHIFFFIKMYTLLLRRIYAFYWLTSVEINKHKIFDANNA